MVTVTTVSVVPPPPPPPPITFNSPLDIINVSPSNLIGCSIQVPPVYKKSLGLFPPPSFT
nr:MAG TPA: hypothetical protein [Caudoviricetes sp.]